MWNVNTLDVIMVVLRIGEQVQTVAWPIIFYLGQANYCQDRLLAV